MCLISQDQIRRMDENENEKKISLTAVDDGEEGKQAIEQAEDRKKGFLATRIQDFGFKAKTPEEWRQDISLQGLKTKTYDNESFRNDLRLLSKLATRSSFMAIRRALEERGVVTGQGKSSNDRDHVQELGHVIFCAATLALVKTLKFWKIQIFWYVFYLGCGFSIKALRTVGLGLGG